jgi:hypothetical protein
MTDNTPTPNLDLELAGLISELSETIGKVSDLLKELDKISAERRREKENINGTTNINP